MSHEMERFLFKNHYPTSLSNKDESFTFADDMYAFSGTVNGNTTAGTCTFIPSDIPL